MMRGTFFQRRGRILLMMLFFLGVVVFGEDKAVNEDQKLREEILAVYKSGGEQGLRDFVEKEKDKISNKFIVDFAEAGVKERKEEWLKVSEIIVKEKKDEKTLADVLYQTGEYFRLISYNKKAMDYFDKALPIYLKLNDPIGQGMVYLEKGIIIFHSGKFDVAIKMYNKALSLFVKGNDLKGKGNAYIRISLAYLVKSNREKAIESLDKSLFFFEKAGDIIGQGNYYLIKGLIYSYNGDYSRELELYGKSMVFFKKAEYTLGQGNVYSYMGDVYLRLGDNSKALEMYDMALPFFNKSRAYMNQCNIYISKGDIYFYSGDISKALEMYDKALPFYEKIGNPLGIGNIYLSKGDIFFRNGDNSNALEMYDKALNCFIKWDDPIGQANVHFSKGDFYFYTGDKLNAIKMYEKSLFLYIKEGDFLGQGNVYHSEGDFYLSTGDYIRALEKFEKAYIIYEKLGNKIGLGNVFFSKGDIYFYLGSYFKALHEYNKAIPFFKKAKEPIGQGNFYKRKGDIYFYLGEKLKALKIYRKALSFFDKARYNIGQGNVCRSMGDIYLKMCDNIKSLEMYNKALAYYREVDDIDSESIALNCKAKLLVNIGEKDEALALFEKGILNLEKVRSQTAFAEMKRDYMEMVYSQYEETVLFMLENRYYYKGFKYAESMKSRVFLDRMAEQLVRLDKGLKTVLKETRDNLVAKLSSINKQIYEAVGGKDEKKLQELKEQYRKTEDEFDELLIKIRLDNPLYASVRYPRPISVRELQKDVLKQGEILVRYFISPEKLYVFLVSKKKFKVFPLDVKKEEIKGLVKQYLNALKENDSIRMKRYGKTLYEKIFKPLEKRIKKSKDIIIIPDGELATIPFESFIVDNKGQARPVFLLEKYRVKYLQSASLLKILRQHYQNNRETNSFIGFGDPVYDYENFKLGKPEKGSITRSSQKEDEIKEIHRSRYARAGGIMDRLPGSGEEVKTIARLFEKESQKSVLHLREEATEDNANTPGMKDFDYIHFTCHGLLNDDFQSLVLSQLPEDQSSEDGYFTLNEIMNCDYNAKLVVLSACQTGSGKLERAEGVTGMTRAVMYAGTPAVVATLWKVDDEVTKELMIKFYENMLEKNLDKAEALRQAKLELFKNKKYRSPLFWSSFVMYGE